ncbi:MAG: hypothetical protein RLZZ116_1636 [Planctomycetota bacterium]|jgi:hypothetical protein
MQDPFPLDLKTAQRLCSAAADAGMRPVDGLVEQASHERRPQWALEAARGLAPDIERVIASGDLAEIDRMRVAAKAGFHESASVRERNAALLVYAVAIAAALDRFGELLTSQPHEEVDTLLAGAARCVHPEWAAMFDRAIVRHARVRERRPPAA